MQEDEAQALVEAMLDANALELLVQRLATLDEGADEEAAAVYAALSILENMVELKPEVSEQVVEKTKVGARPPPPPPSPPSRPPVVARVNRRNSLPPQG